MRSSSCSKCSSNVSYQIKVTMLFIELEEPIIQQAVSISLSLSNVTDINDLIRNVIYKKKTKSNNIRSI